VYKKNRKEQKLSNFSIEYPEQEAIMMLFKKMMISVFVVFTVLSFNVFATGSSEATSEKIDYPTRPIQIVVPANPGGGTDLGARLVAEFLQKELGQSVVVANMAGAGSTIGMNHVNSARPDGYTVLYINETIIANRVFGLSDFSLKDDYVVVGGPFEVDTTAVLSKDIKSFEELKEVAKKREIIFGAEAGSIQHIIFAAIKDETGMNMSFIDTGAVSPSLAALEGGHIDLTSAPLASFKDAYEARHYHALGFVSATKRSEFAPEVPTFTELGVDAFFPKIFILALPPSTPDSVANILRDALKRVVENKDFQDKARAYSYNPVFLTPEVIIEMEESLFKVMEKYVGLVKK
jgi:tripartite-type tricarboxylate transporter receptor subunit TctC